MINLQNPLTLHPKRGIFKSKSPFHDLQTIFFNEWENNTRWYMLEFIPMSDIKTVAYMWLSSHTPRCDTGRWGTSDESSCLWLGGGAKIGSTPLPRGSNVRGEEICTENERKGESRYTQLRVNFTLFSLFFSMSLGWGLNSTTSDQDMTKNQMGVVTPTYPHVENQAQKWSSVWTHLETK